MGAIRFFLMVPALLGCCLAQAGQESAKVFWSSDQVRPGDAVMIYGGGLNFTSIQVGPVEAGATKFRPLSALQNSPESMKFILPRDFPPGLFEVDLAPGKNWILNGPVVWFVQPERLEPGLQENELVAGASFQVVGKNFLVPGIQPHPKLEILSKNKRVAQAEILDRSPEPPASPFTVRARLPGSLPEGEYQLRFSHGAGGEKGWSDPLPFRVRKPNPWPDKEWNVRGEFGARGDGVADDTAAIRRALAAAEKNGGGTIFFPAGTYRLKDWIRIPPQTRLRGEVRDGTILQWPVDEPQTERDFTHAAVYGDQSYALEELTLIARKVEHLLWDLSRSGPLPPELAGKIRKEGSRDVFLRRVAFHHWIHCSHPDRNAELWNSRYRPDRNPYNFLNDQVVNFEVSDCLFQGASQLFHNVRNGRIVRNEFSNGMGTCWTALAQGAVVVVAEKNDLRCSSSWGYGRIGIDRVFSSENICHNFVQGGREAMTLDISATPATPPGPVPEGSSNPNGIHNRNIAWFGFPKKVGPDEILLEGIRAEADQFVGKTVMVLDGPGVGQFRRILQNTSDRFVLDQPWDVLPTPTSTLGLWDLSRQMIVTRCEGYDTSSFAQLWGSFYEYIVDDCRVDRSQGLWGQSGWFVQFRNNRVRYGHAYHPKIGMRGPNPEGNSPFGYLGLMDGDLRITKFGSAQYSSPDGKPLFVREVLGRQIPGIRGCVLKGNQLAYNQRMVLVPSPSAPAGPEPLLVDAVVEDNQVLHSTVGLAWGGRARGILSKGNRFESVDQPYVGDRALIKIVP